MQKNRIIASGGTGVATLKKPRRFAASILAAILLFTSVYAAAEAKSLVPVGRAVGIRINCDGAVVVGVPDKCSDESTPSPAKSAGVKPGDIITHVNETEVHSGEELRAATGKLGDAPVVICAQRGGETVRISVTPVKTADGDMSLGIWVRDGVSGIGTVTFYDPETNVYGALGHAVNDTETGVRLPVRDGIIGSASVTDVRKGKSGSPGQLHGAFSFETKLGTITNNSSCGIFGTVEDAFPGTAMEVADESEIHVGDAYILSNVAGTEVRKYAAEISRVYTGAESDGRTMLVTIKDDALTGVTGGIVQGMSGSPIIQDGKLVGAVTHVLIGDPSRGYGVSIQKMLEQIEK